MFKTTPLSDTFMIVCMVGMIVFGVRTFSGSMDPNWGFTLTVLFFIGFMASVVSITPPSYKDFRKGKFRVN